MTNIPMTCLFLLVIFASPTVLIPVEKTSWIMGHGSNVWTTLAEDIGTDTVCLSTFNPTNPFKTSLIGIPLSPREWGEFKNKYIPWCDDHDQFKNPFVDCVTRPENTLHIKLNFTHQWERPEELEILGSIVSPQCFSFIPNRYVSFIENFNVTGYAKYADTNFWCKEDLPNIIQATSDSVVLPKSIFLICGNRAWKMIPRLAIGGPCTFGKLTLYNPAVFLNQLPKSPPQSENTFPKTRARRSFKAIPFKPRQPNVEPVPEPHPIEKIQHLKGFSEGCDSNVKFWSTPTNVLGSFYIPAIGTIKALNILTKIGCWLAKEANATSLALEGLLSDTQQNKKALLQNRAAIDFLLLVNGHGCQEFQGLCCLNFSDHSSSIHNQINKIKNLVSDLKENADFSVDGLFNWFPSKNWGTAILKFLVMVLIILIFVALILSCVCAIGKKYCLPQAMSILLSYNNQLSSLKDKIGGDVGSQKQDEEETREEKKPNNILNMTQKEYDRWRKNYLNEEEPCSIRTPKNPNWSDNFKDPDILSVEL